MPDLLAWPSKSIIKMALLAARRGFAPCRRGEKHCGKRIERQETGYCIYIPRVRSFKLSPLFPHELMRFPYAEEEILTVN